MSKLCTVTFEKISVSAVQDLLAIKADSAKPIRIRRYWLGVSDSALPVSNMLALRARYSAAALTLGSGGASATPVNLTPADSTTISATAHRNDTSKATSAGSFVICDEIGAHVFTGYDSGWSGRDPIEIPAGGGFVWEIITAPASAIVMSGGIDFDELG